MSKRPAQWGDSGGDYKRRRSDDGGSHSTPPSKVLHIRNVADGAREQDVLMAVKSFGKVAYVTLMPRQRQGLVEFEDLSAAERCVDYNKTREINICSRPAFFNFSVSQSIKRPPHAGGNVGPQYQEYGPNKILLMTILNPMYPITVEVIHSISSRYGDIQRIAIFHKNGVQALVEFGSVDQAARAKEMLDGADIYAGCCTLKIEYSKTDRVNVAVNNEESWDYTGDRRAFAGQVQPRGYDGTQADPHAGMQGYGYDPYGRDPYGSYGYEGEYDGSYDNYGQAGYEGSAVLMVYNLDPERINCDKLFNIFCAYGNVVRIKVFVKKTGAAMVQMDQRDGAMNALKWLNQASFMGKQLQLSFSRHSMIEDRGLVGSLPDGTPAVSDYSNSRNNRFMTPEQSRKNHMIHPSKVLHFYNAPPAVTVEDLKKVFVEAKAPVPIRSTIFDKRGNPAVTRSTGLVEWEDEGLSLEAMAICNHATIHGPNGQPFTLKLAFSQTAPRSSAPDDSSSHK